MQNKIAKYRKKAGLTQIELAERIGVNQSTISSWESNKFSPEFETIKKLAEVFEIDANELYFKTLPHFIPLEFSEVDNEQLISVLKGADEIINLFRYMTSEEHKNAVSIIKAAFPNAVGAAKLKNKHYNPYQEYVERTGELWESEKAPEQGKEAELSEKEQIGKDGRLDIL